jgi:nitrate/nitrite transporter NarK
MGGGLTQFVMPLIYQAILACGASSFAAWRYVFFVPGVLQLVAAFLILEYSQDLPDGQYAQLRKSGQKVSGLGVLHQLLVFFLGRGDGRDDEQEYGRCSLYLTGAELRCPKADRR